MGKHSERARAVVELTPSAKKDLKKLKKELSHFSEAELYNAFESICNEPLSGKSLQGNLSKYRSFRLAKNYRIIYEIIRHPQETIIRIHGIGDRKDIYDRIFRFFL